MNRILCMGTAVLLASACGSAQSNEELAEDQRSIGGETEVAVTPPIPAPASDIVATAVAAGSFDTLAAALDAAGLVETLKSEGPYTVFAPTDDAFAALPPGTVDDLLLPENRDKLISVLTYHVVPGDVRAADVVNLTEARTVQGQTLAVDASAGVKINNANVTQADIACSNGVIHIIDTVLLPPES